MNIKKYYYSEDGAGYIKDESYQLETFDEKIIRLKKENCKILYVQYYNVENIGKEELMFVITIKF